MTTTPDVAAGPEGGEATVPAAAPRRRRPRDIGTAHTTAVINYLRANGFAQAELRNQAGAHDKGDIIGLVGVCVECKGGKAAENASDGQVELWLAETERERVNAAADVGVLVLKRKGIGAVNAGRYWAVMSSRQLVVLHDVPIGALYLRTPVFPVRMLLADAVAALRWAGYGDPLPEGDG